MFCREFCIKKSFPETPCERKVHKIFRNGDKVPKGYVGTDDVFLRGLATMIVYNLSQDVIGNWNLTTGKIDFNSKNEDGWREFSDSEEEDSDYEYEYGES